MPLEHKESEKFVNQSEEKFKMILENANDLITIINEEFRHEYINEKAYFNLLGYTSEDIIGKTPLIPLQPDDIKIVEKALRNGFKYGEGTNEMRVRHKDGHFLWLEHKGKTFIDTDGKRKAIIISRDISERKKIEKLIKESERKYRSMVNNLSDIILEGDSKANVTFISPQCYEIMGYHPSELIGKNAFNYIHPEDVPKIVESMKIGLKTKEIISVPRYRLLHKNGNIVYVSARGKYVIMNGIERFIVVIRDITTQTKIEQKLKESEERYRLISENANDLICILNEHLELEYVNKKPFLKILGYNYDELIGKNGLEFVHPDDREYLINEFKKPNKLREEPIEASLRHKNGHFLTLEANAQFFIDKEGKQKILVIARDISERKKVETMIIEENKELLELSQTKSELIMNVSHELKTPLSSIYAASQILLKGFKDQFGEQTIGFLEMIYRGGQKLKQLIENLLDISRVESGKFNLNPQKENLVEIVNECIDDLRYWADKRSIIINTEFPKELFVLIDRIRIEQVITNLLSNAIKYTPLKGNIYINLDSEDQFVEISVRDTGIGLTKKEQKNLFQKFGKTERFGKDLEVETESSGLGLYISKEIIELHKGKILVKSQGRNKGSTFTIKLPK
ncbi:MAG: PAS domain S-box protein [Candidatus Hermodarchaeota archaeon]